MVHIDLRKLLLGFFHLRMMACDGSEQLVRHLLVFVDVENISLLGEESGCCQTPTIQAVVIISIRRVKLCELFLVLRLDSFSLRMVGISGWGNKIRRARDVSHRLNIETASSTTIRDSNVLRFRANHTKSKCFCTWASAVSLIEDKTSVNSLLRKRRASSSSTPLVGETGARGTSFLTLDRTLLVGILSGRRGRKHRVSEGSRFSGNGTLCWRDYSNHRLA